MYLGFQVTWQRVLHELHNIVQAKVTSVNEVYQNPFKQLEGIQYLSGPQACQRCTKSLYAHSFSSFSILSYERSKASSKTIPPHSAI